MTKHVTDNQLSMWLKSRKIQTDVHNSNATLIEYVHTDNKSQSLTFNRVYFLRSENASYSVLSSSIHFTFYVSARRFQNLACFFDDNCSSIPLDKKDYLLEKIRQTAIAVFQEIFKEK